MSVPADPPAAGALAPPPHEPAPAGSCPARVPADPPAAGARAVRQSPVSRSGRMTSVLIVPLPQTVTQSIALWSVDSMVNSGR